MLLYSFADFLKTNRKILSGPLSECQAVWIGPDLVPNCLQMLSAVTVNKERVQIALTD